jgi:hypothetical protein
VRTRRPDELSSGLRVLLLVDVFLAYGSVEFLGHGIWEQVVKTLSSAYNVFLSDRRQLLVL